MYIDHNGSELCKIQAKTFGPGRQACSPLIQLFFGFVSESVQPKIFSDRETAISCLRSNSDTGVGRVGGLRIEISVVFQWTHSPTPPPPSCCCHRRHCRRRMYWNIFEYFCHRIYSYSYSVDIFKPNIFVAQKTIRSPLWLIPFLAVQNSSNR